ncbi:unnamed protein product [Angiostrongylus costaricensis]|uniref:Uncharacterized protein n=1 Tax=Angiostrongylus costaricensis TaxID=334426 RepID=A0A0R3PGP0_ANGCS|nr:unnamed protein product [Angiostrongylus costaricensis]
MLSADRRRSLARLLRYPAQRPWQHVLYSFSTETQYYDLYSSKTINQYASQCMISLKTLIECPSSVSVVRSSVFLLPGFSAPRFPSNHR